MIVALVAATGLYIVYFGVFGLRKGFSTLGVSGLTQGMIIGYLEGHLGYGMLVYSVLTYHMFVTRCLCVGKADRAR